jgi:5-enolpyruvylshikimate-3-phosphate synthase
MELKNTIQAMQKLGGSVVKEGKQILKRKKKTTSQNTLYKGFDYLVTADKSSITLTFEFGGAEDYWNFVDEGVKGSGGFKGSGKMRGQGSPFRFRKKNIARGVVAKWIKNKPLKLRGAKGKFIEKTQANIKSAAFVIGRAIAQRGLTRTQFFSRPFTEQFNKQTDAILEAFGNDVEKQLELGN